MATVQANREARHRLVSMWSERFYIPEELRKKEFDKCYLKYWTGKYLDTKLHHTQVLTDFIVDEGVLYYVYYTHQLTPACLKANPTKQFALSFRTTKLPGIAPKVIISR